LEGLIASPTFANFIRSSPLPPISRLEEASQARYCSRLRRQLSQSLKNILSRYSAAYRALQPLIENEDLERYYDIYELSRAELQEVDPSCIETDLEAAESLKSLKNLLNRLHSARKIVFCNLLALGTDDGSAECAKWSLAVDELQALASITRSSAQNLSDMLAEDDSKNDILCLDLENFLTGADREVAESVSKSPLSPKDQQLKAQLRRLNSLSQGIRALHAKIHVFREESDGNLEQLENEPNLARALAMQYDSIGADLRALLQEWEVGKAASSLNTEWPKRFSSRSSGDMRSPMSPTLSLGGQTVVGGSPSDALRILNGEEVPQTTIDASDEEIFEAIAAPRKRSSMTREERIARMKEDRLRQSIAREKADANTHMLKELETVIKLRPRGKTTSRITSM
jgi:NAD-dependent DNA ligase